MNDMVIITLIIFTIGIGVSLIYIVGKRIVKAAQKEYDHYLDPPSKLDDYIYEKELENKKRLEKNQ